MNRPQILKAMATAGIALVFLFATKPASADAIQISGPADFTSPVIINSDSGSSETIVFTITNTTTAKQTQANPHSLEIDDFTATLGAHFDNPADYVTDLTISGGTCYDGMILTEGGPDGSCTFDLTLDFVGGPPTKGHPNPFGGNNITLRVDSHNPSTSGGDDIPLIDVKDTLGFKAQIDYAPEPSSLILLGTGLLGLAGAMRRKISRS